MGSYESRFAEQLLIAFQRFGFHKDFSGIGHDTDIIDICLDKNDVFGIDQNGALQVRQFQIRRRNRGA